jgi:signal transduction histidine kinase
MLGNKKSSSKKSLDTTQLEEILQVQKIISKCATSLNLSHQLDEIYKISGKSVQQLMPDAYIIVSGLNEAGTSLDIKEYLGFGSLVEKIIDLIGKDPRHLSYYIDDMQDHEKHLFTSGKMQLVENGLYALSTKNISKLACKAVEKFLNLGDVYSMSFSFEEMKPIGGISILLKKDQKLSHVDAIETIVKQTAIAINRKNTGLDLIKAKEKAEESERLKSAFLANISHEIRTPLNGIVGFANLIKEKDLAKEARDRYIKIINSNTEQLLTLIDDILSVSRIEAGEINIVKAPFIVDKMLEEIEYECKYKADVKEKGLEVVFKRNMQFQKSIIESDEIRIRQIISNLIGNAIHYTEKGRIEFGYKITRESALFYVKDTGIGIAEEDKERIFERFAQVRENKNMTYRGVGIGLSICKGITNILGGNIWVESEAGKGAIFYVKIPVKIINDHILPYDQSKKNTRNLKIEKKRIVIFEDDPVSADFLMEILKPYKPEIECYEDGEKLHEILSVKNPPDLVILDIRLPGKSGYEIAKEIKERDQTIPILAQTAYASPHDKQKCLKAGCDDYISKPITEVELFEKLLKIIN